MTLRLAARRHAAKGLVLQPQGPIAPRGGNTARVSSRAERGSEAGEGEGGGLGWRLMCISPATAAWACAAKHLKTATVPEAAACDKRATCGRASSSTCDMTLLFAEENRSQSLG